MPQRELSSSRLASPRHPAHASDFQGVCLNDLVGQGATLWLEEGTRDGAGPLSKKEIRRPHPQDDQRQARMTGCSLKRPKQNRTKPEKQLYGFPEAADINYDKPGGLKQQKVILS